MKLRAIFREDVVNGLYDVILVENQFRIKLCSSFNHQPKESKSDKQRKTVKKVIEFEYEPTSAVDFNIVRSSFNKASTIILKQNGVEQPPYENVILQDAILPYREMHNVYENEYGSYKDMNNFLLQPEVRDFTTMYKLCSGGKNALTTDDMKQAIKLIKNNNGTMQCKPMSNDSDVEEYEKAFPKCHRGKVYTDQERRTEECPYLDETLAGARRALGNQDFQDVATQGKAVRWPENYQQAQRFGKVVGKLDSEYIEGSKTISPDDLAFLRRKKRMRERGEDETTPDSEFLKGGYGLSKNNYLRIVECAYNNSMLRDDYENKDPPLEIEVSEDRSRIKSGDEAIRQCKFRDHVLLYNHDYVIKATIDRNGNITFDDG